MTQKLTILAIFAHPDDEAFGTAGTLTKYAQKGVDVHLIVATRGEAGQINNPEVAPVKPFSLLREKELRQACQVYGATLHLLEYLDGQTAVVPPSEAVFKLVKLIREIKPQVVIGFGPEGIYGHFDHLVLHRWASAAVTLAGQAEQWAETGQAHQVDKFYYRVLPQSQVEHMAERVGYNSVDMNGIPFPFVGYPAEEITTIVDICEVAQQKLAAIRCYASQLAPDTPFVDAKFEPLDHDWFIEECFILAKVHGAAAGRPTTPVEKDLFAGVQV